MSQPADIEATKLQPSAARAYAGALARATPRDGIDGVVPRQVATPSNLEEVADLLATAARERSALACVGGGTQIAVGNAPRAFDIALRTSGLARVVEHNPDDMTIGVQAGMSLAALDELLARTGQRVAIDAADARATIGGAMMTNATGGLAYGFGLPRDLVLGMTVVDGAGRTLHLGGRVVKNVSGYDLVRLFAGSFGTLGVAVDLTLRTHPRPAHAATLGVEFDDAESLDIARTAIFATALPLASFDFVQDDVPAARWTLRLRHEAISLREASYQRTEIERLCGRRAVEASHECSPTFAPSHHDVVVRIGTSPASVVETAQELACNLARPLRLAGRCGDGLLRVSARCGDASEAHALALEIRRRMNARGHRVVIERLPADRKSGTDVWDEAPAGLRLMQELKRRFDPAGILSPGRFVGGI